MAEFTKAKKFTNLMAISPLDGRFRGNVENYSEYFSEFATMRLRVEVEIRYLEYISQILNLDPLPKLDSIYLGFNQKDAQWIENKDLEINHDAKAVEYFLREKLRDLKLDKYINYLHIGITSADIDSNSLMLSVQRFEKDIFSNIRKNVLKELKIFSKRNLDSVFLAKTHGKHAVPTTMGKEFANFYNRLEKIHTKLSKHRFEGKLTGAVGNFNAMITTYPDIDWYRFSENFVKSLDLTPNMFTTQILPYDNLLEYLNLVTLFNNIVIDLARDCWEYISRGHLVLKVVSKEVGSSTMPHKVNPISFEGAESNLLLSSNSINLFTRELSTNRLQRDLTDKYIAREIGVSLSQSALGYSMILGGIKNIYFNDDFSKEELDQHWEVLSEAIQTILRREGCTESYERIKELTRGKSLSKDDYLEIIDSMKDISDNLRNELKSLNPSEYTGWARNC